MAKQKQSSTFNLNIPSSFKRLPVSSITVGSMSPDTKNPFSSTGSLGKAPGTAETGISVNNNFGGNITKTPDFEATSNIPLQVETKSETFEVKPIEKPKYNINFLEILPKNYSSINIPADLNNNPNGILKTSAKFSITKSQKILNNEFSFSVVLIKNGQEKINEIPKSSVIEQTVEEGKTKIFLISSDFPILQYGAHSLYFVISSNIDQSKFMSPLVQFSVVVDKLILNTGNIQVISGAFGEELNINAEPPIFYTNLMKDSKNNVLFEFLKPFVNINKAVADKNPDSFFKAQPKEIKVYRTTTQPSKLEDIYNNTNLHKTLIVSNGLMFTETLDIDQEYYYMADYKASYSSVKTDPIKPPGTYDWSGIESLLTPPLSNEEKDTIIKVADTLNTPQSVQDWNNKVISDNTSEFNPSINSRLYIGVLYAVDNRNVIDLNTSLGITDIVNTAYGISSVFKISVGRDNEFYYLDRKVINFEDLKEKKLIKDINSKIFIEPNYSYNFENVKTLTDLFTKSTVFPFLTGNPSFDSKTNFGYYKIRLTSKKTKRKIDINIKNTLLQKFNYLDSINLLKNKKYNILSLNLDLIINADLYNYFLNLVPKKIEIASEENSLYNNLLKIYKIRIYKYEIEKISFDTQSMLEELFDYQQNVSDSLQNILGVGSDEYLNYRDQILNPSYVKPLNIVISPTFNSIENIRLKALYDSINQILFENNDKNYNKDNILKAKNEILKYNPSLEGQLTQNSIYGELTQKEKDLIESFLQSSIKTFDIGTYSALKIDSTDLLQVIKNYLQKINQIANFLNKNTKSNISFSYIAPNQLIINNPTISFISAIENEDKNIADKFNLKINLLQ